jgi:3-methyladenine DNA glycosylase AlkD
MTEIDLAKVGHQFALDGTAERAANQKAYLKSELDFFGISVPTVRAALKREMKANPITERAELLKKSLECFEWSHFEMQLFGVLLLDKHSNLLEPQDLNFIADLVGKCNTWALVDPLSGPAGRLVDLGLPDVGPFLDSWSTHENFWLRRFSLLVLMRNLRENENEWARFVGYADSMIEEKEFFVRKAIGWVLRDQSRIRPEAVAEYVRRQMPVISGVTFREAVKYLPEPEQSELRTAYQAR